MMRIEKLSSAPDGVGRFRVQFSDGSTLRLYRQTLEDFGLYAGMELTETDFDRLVSTSGEMSAKMRAVRIISAASVSKKDLQQRLIQKGEDPNQAQQAVAWLSDLDLIDDRKTAEHIVDRCIRRGYGISRAKQALYEKRIPKELWDEALAEYPDQSEAIAQYLQDKLSSDADEKQVKRVIDALLRRGHSYGAVSRELRKLDQDFE